MKFRTELSERDGVYRWKWQVDVVQGDAIECIAYGGPCPTVADAQLEAAEAIERHREELRKAARPEKTEARDDCPRELAGLARPAGRAAPLWDSMEGVKARWAAQKRGKRG